ncbi:hypothetical protein ASG40_05915 [Methylobacterium sp. Leaf399]|uniref:diguanylate cyclase domain-containing protein n=1 Tax=Methylobacterium sp. Leaf399 TaxID=1736364 RepID=UPI00071448F8|nr:diguanylate cyclase [Methylobacterium sp. Leaf399]KQT14838.1 hypothetical protein ASG40_05915 [Methylobacterium sp. Leaf399]
MRVDDPMMECDDQPGRIDAELLRIRSLSDAIVDGVAIVSPDGLILEANASLGGLLGCDPRALVGSRAEELATDAHRGIVLRAICAPEGTAPVEIVLAGPDAIGVEIQHRRVVLGGASLGLLNIHDLRARSSAVERVGRHARYDPLTGLRNRLGLDHVVDVEHTGAGRYGAEFAVLCLDLDGFKAINDNHGHAAGDEALRVVARRLKDATRESDLVFRLGGDEFVILQAFTGHPSQSVRLAERLVAAIGLPFFVADAPLHLGVSIGIAHHPHQGRSIADLLRNADAALYKAKREGKNTFRVFDPSLDDAVERRRAIEADLLFAIDRGELELAYEPQIDVATGSVSGFDVGLSWHSARLGPIAPAVFVPIAEQAGLMTSIGDWLIHEACRQAASWTRPLGIAVPVCPSQLTGGDVALSVSQALALTGLDPTRLRVDVGEAAVLAGGRSVTETLMRLRALKVRLGLENFGAGTASIAALDGGTFGNVKLAGLFARPEAPASRLAAILAACRAFALPVTATSVDCPEMRDRLAAAGVDGILGPVVSPARAIASFAPLVGAVRPAPTPAAGGAEAGSAADRLRPFRPERLPVLVVDDSEIIGATLVSLLGAFGFSDVRYAGDGEEAWTLLRRHRFELVISDWTMTPVNGIELLARIRADAALAPIRFLMLTANARSAARLAARDAGVDGFLVKPFRPDALAAKIVAMLAAPPSLDEAC